MIQKSQAFMDAWLNGKQKFILLSFSDSSTLDDESVVSESFSLTQSLCEEDQLCFGLTSSAMCSVQIMNTGKQYKGLEMTVQMSAVDDEENYYVMDLGTYKIESDVRSDDRLYRTLTGYDALYGVLNADYSDFYNSYMGSSRTLKQFRDAFFSHIGVVQETATLPQDSLTLVKKPNVTSLSGADIIRGICEINAAFGFINYDGKFQYSTPTERSRAFPANDLYPSNSLYPSGGADITLDGDDVESAPIMGGLIYSDYFTHKITGAEFARTENTPSASAGTSTNVYQFRDSVLMYGQTANTLQGICSAFVNLTKEFFYNPGRVTGRARVWAQLGDVLRASTDRDSIVIPILKRTMSGVTALYDTYEANGTEYYTYSPNSYEAQQTDQATSLAEVNDYVAEVEEQVEQLDQEWRNSVSAAIDVWDETNENIDEYGFGVPTAESGSITWDGNYDETGYGEPYNDSYTVEDVGRTYLDESNGYIYTIQQELDVEPLGNGQSMVHTVYIWVHTGQTTGTWDSYDPSDVGKKYLDEETGKVYALESYTESGITKYRWVYDKQLGTTKAALQTQITQNATDITLEASRAVSSENSLQASINVNATAITQRVEKGDVVSEINQSADTISLTAGRLLITTGNFQLDASGNATATNFVAKAGINIKGRNSSSNYVYLSANSGAQLWVGTSENTRNADIVCNGVYGQSSFSTSGNITATGDVSGSRVFMNNQLVALADDIPSLSGYVNDVEQESWSNTWTTWNNHTIVKSAKKSGKTITVTNVTVNVSSDKRLKKGIRELDDFTKVYMRLKPVRYKYHDDLGFEDRGIHFGFIAQDFKRICDEEGIDLSNNEYAIWHTRQADALGHEDKYVKDDGLQEFILDEFHALHIQMIQKQQRQIEEQGKEIESLKSEVAELKALLKEVLNVGKQE